MLNPYIDARGIFHGILFDIYDFEFLLSLYLNLKIDIAFANNIAWLFQYLGIIDNYFILVPISFEW